MPYHAFLFHIAQTFDQTRYRSGVRQLAEDKGDFVAEEGGGIGEAGGQGVHGRDGGGEGWWGGEVAQGEHGAVAQEEGDCCVEESGLEFFYFGDDVGLGEWWSGIDG